MMRRVVVFPQPLGPSKVKNSPWRICRSMPLTAARLFSPRVAPENTLLTSLSSTANGFMVFGNQPLNSAFGAQRQSPVSNLIYSSFRSELSAYTHAAQPLRQQQDGYREQNVHGGFLQVVCESRKPRRHDQHHVGNVNDGVPDGDRPNAQLDPQALEQDQQRHAQHYVRDHQRQGGDI